MGGYQPKAEKYKKVKCAVAAGPTLNGLALRHGQWPCRFLGYCTVGVRFIDQNDTCSRIGRMHIEKAAGLTLAGVHAKGHRQDLYLKLVACYTVFRYIDKTFL